MGSIEFRKVSKRYGAVDVIQALDLRIAEGEFVALVGPSGCGKSTTLRMLAGLEDITGGDILIQGQRVNELGPRQRNIAMVFQNYALYPHMTVAQNIGLNLKISRVPKAEIRRRVSDAATLLDIADLLDRRPSQLSGGQRQRVAMGRAIVRDPSVFLFDEPLSNLDALLRVQMRGEIKRFHKQVGKTTIYVTHDQIEAMTLADRVVVMKGGAIAQEGEPPQLYERPQSLFVAGFIGSPRMNFLPARISSNGAGRLALRLSDGQAFTVLGARPDLPERQVVLGIRPEHLRPSGDEHGLVGRVTLTEFTGASAIVSLALAGTEVSCLLDNRHLAREGESLRLTVDRDRVHLFDPASERRIDWEADRG
jgi:multiple sugar transport system ATP-binding protein